MKNMNAEQRRIQIINILKNKTDPISASYLASELGVSRQIIVGDIALLRAKDYEIIATPRGYLLDANRVFPYIGTVVCSHGKNDIENELNIIVDNGGVCLDVVVSHKIYGDLSGTLNIKSRYDVQGLINKLDDETLPLSILSSENVHLHHIGCDSKDTFSRIENELIKAEILFK